MSGRLETSPGIPRLRLGPRGGACGRRLAAVASMGTGRGYRRRSWRLLASVAIVAVATGCEGMDLGWGPNLERMIQQPKYEPYEQSDFFDDRLAMRPPPPKTVPMEALGAPGPVPPTPELLALGRTRFDIYCGVCHGLLGDGSSPVAQNMQLRPPPSLHLPYIRTMPDTLLHQVVVQGYGIMPGYAMQLSHEEQWAVVVYIRALQMSRSVPIVQLPAAVREELERMP